ncbi:hypothetical protein GGI15_001951 [Coemansia interrupta]|uniref:Uncharacterized protein n=1 Tax=Coemansia interrupta TaxID=1126814 RepID=A0A9W8LMU3_9FUNG|nr:hypothetical protein GGI15_001951 [Coemansia interrupta]
MISSHIARAGKYGARRQLRPIAGLIQRSYTNTSVYTRMDNMSHDEHLKLLLDEQRYLTELLKTDDSQAPWRREAVDTVSREVQEGLHEPHQWVPEDTFHY